MEVYFEHLTHPYLKGYAVGFCSVCRLLDSKLKCEFVFKLLKGIKIFDKGTCIGNLNQFLIQNWFEPTTSAR